MIRQLSDILQLSVVEDILLFSQKGKLLYAPLSCSARQAARKSGVWGHLLKEEYIHEARFLFEKGGYYVHRTSIGFIVTACKNADALEMVAARCHSIGRVLKDKNARRQILEQLLFEVPDECKPAAVEELAYQPGAQTAAILLALLDTHQRFDVNVKDQLLITLCRALGDCAASEAIQPLQDFMSKCRDDGELSMEVEKELKVSLQQLEFARQGGASPELRDGYESTGLIGSLAEKERPGALADKRPSQKTAVDSRPSSVHEPPAAPAGKHKSAEELRIKKLLKRGQKQEAVDIIMQHIEAAARQKKFERAERLRNTLIQIDSMLLSEIIRAAEIIEEHKQSSIPAEHLETWRSLVDLLGAEEFAALYHVMTLKQYSKGEMVVRQGAFLSQLLFVNSGQIQLHALVKGSEVPLKTVGQGEVVGGRTFFESSVWTVSARSLGAQIFILPRKQLTRLLDAYPSLESKLIDFAAHFVSANTLFQKTKRNRRRFERKAIDGRAVAALLNANNTNTGIEMKGDLFDISRGGVSFCVHISKKENAEKLFRRRIRVGIPVGKGVNKKYHYHCGVIVAIQGHHVVSNEYSLHVQFDTHLDFQEVEQIAEEWSGK